MLKKIIAFMTLILCLFTTVVCAEIIEVKRTEIVRGRDGTTYLVNENTYTISDSKNEYKYSVKDSAIGQTIEITYPDGSTYWESGENGSYSIGWSDDYIAFNKDNEKNYTPGDILCDVYRSDNPVRAKKNIWPGIICLMIGIFSLLAPELAWYLQYGWRYKDAEPSDAAIIFERVIGVVILILVVLYFVI